MVGFLFFAVDVLKVCFSVHELGYQTEFEAAVLGFTKVVAVELEDVWMVIDFHELNCLFFVFIEFI